MVLALMVVAGCTNCQRSTGAEGNADADGYNSADSLVSALGDARDYPRLIMVTDSLEHKGKLPLVRAIFYRTIAYNLMGQQRKSLSQYYLLTNMDVKKLKVRADIECYIYSYKTMCDCSVICGATIEPCGRPIMQTEN